MSEQLIDYELEKEQRLKEYISNISKLNDEKQRHFLYMSYDHLEEEEHLYEFWRDTVHGLIGKVFKRTYATPHEIVKAFTIDGKRPFGLHNIIQEMKLRKEFIDKEQITDETYYQEASWLSKKFTQALSWFSSAPAVENDTDSPLVSNIWLENVCKSVIEWAFHQDNQVFSKKEIKTLLKKSGKDKEDIKIIMNHLKNTDRMIEDGEWVKIGEKDQVEEITETEKITFRLSNASHELDEKLENTKDKILYLRDKAKQALKNQYKDKATNLLREKKILEKAEGVLIGQKMKIDKQLMDIQMAMSTKDTLQALKLSANQQHLIDENIEEAEEVIDLINEQNYNNQKINEMFSFENQLDEDDEELLKELEEYEEDKQDETNEDSAEKNYDYKNKYQDADYVKPKYARGRQELLLS